MGPSLWSLIAAKDGLFSGPFRIPISGWLKCDKSEAFLFSILPQKEGLPDWRWVGRNFPMVPQKSRTNHWGLTGPSLWALIAAKNGLFSGPFQPDIGVAEMR